jgi:hypothetical protein
MLSLDPMQSTRYCVRVASVSLEYHVVLGYLVPTYISLLLESLLSTVVRGRHDSCRANARRYTKIRISEHTKSPRQCRLDFLVEDERLEGDRSDHGPFGLCVCLINRAKRTTRIDNFTKTLQTSPIFCTQSTNRLRKSIEHFVFSSGEKKVIIKSIRRLGPPKITTD